jgi:hypothetical protein
MISGLQHDPRGVLARGRPLESSVLVYRRAEWQRGEPAGHLTSREAMRET